MRFIADEYVWWGRGCKKGSSSLSYARHQSVTSLSIDRLVTGCRLRKSGSRCVYIIEPAPSELSKVPPRTELLSSPGIFLHAYNRGVDRGPIFFRQSDYEQFITRMAEFLRRSEVMLLAYTLIPNHFHMLVQQLVPYGISRYLKEVCEGYAKYINRYRKRSGHLFQGRYKANDARDPQGLLHLSHYIHYNPVSAGLVAEPAGWKYSS